MTTRATVDLSVNGIPSRIHYLFQPGPDDAPVLLLLHGHASSIDEFEDLLPELEGRAVVYAFDQPSCGKSSEADRKLILEKYGSVPGMRYYEGLFYLRDLINDFAVTVIRPREQGKTNRRVRVAGGSLGGNLTLLVAEKRNPSYPWVEAAYCWSPGSSWPPDLKQALGAQVARQRAQQTWTKRDVAAFLRTTYEDKAVPIGGGFPQPWYWFFDCWGEVDHPECKRKGNGACSRCTHEPVLLLDDGARLETHNYTKMGEKKANAIKNALSSTAKAARPERMAWQWEIAAEQVELSHRQLLKGGRRRIEHLQVPTMFMAGCEDCHFPAALFQETQACYQMALARHQADPTAAKVSAHWFEASGHSLHNERPKELAAILAGPRL